MVELTSKERLQPSLLDRLTDDEPDKLQESRENRVLSINKIRQCVLRDIAWLLNSGKFESSYNLDEYSYVKHSVINYGIPDLAGRVLSSIQIKELENQIQQSIWDFEPRILRDTVKVTISAFENQMNHNALTFKIEGDLWAQPLPLRLYLKTELDLDTGTVSVIDQGG